MGLYVLNTGGPPAKEFFDITQEDWLHYFYQLFYGFVYLLQNIHINDNGYIFLISSNASAALNPDTEPHLPATYLIFLAFIKQKNDKCVIVFSHISLYKYK